MSSETAVDARRGPGARSFGKEARVKARLQSSIDGGDLYSALQMYKTYASRKLNAGKYTETARLYQEGAQLLAEKQSYTATNELVQLLLDTWSEANEDLVNCIDSLQSIFTHYKDSEEKLDCIRSILKWLADYKNTIEDQRVSMKAKVHSWGAYTAHAIKDYSAANSHFLLAASPKEYADFIIEWSNSGYASELDLFYTRAVMQLLVMGNLRDANLLYQRIIERENQRISEAPLTHFTKFLLKTLEYDALPLLRLIVHQYHTAFNRDPYLMHLANQIALRYYQLPLDPNEADRMMRQRQGGGDLGSMMQSMFGNMLGNQ